MESIISRYIKAYKLQKNTNIAYLKELHWANVYHDSIKGCEWLEKLPLNIGRFAGNYAFFYLLNRILKDAKPKSILELGLGESTKFVSTFLKNHLTESEHLVIEHNENWIELFNSGFQINSQSRIQQLELVTNTVKTFETTGYKNFNSNIKLKYELYIIDGPFGSKKFSRYDIIEVINRFNKNEEFIIVFDDYNRIGEKETVIDLLNILEQKGICYSFTVLKGIKDVGLIVSRKYSFLITV